METVLEFGSLPTHLRHVNKEGQNPIFEVWLAAFQSHLVEVARGCALAKPPDANPSKEEEDPPPPRSGADA